MNYEIEIQVEDDSYDQVEQASLRQVAAMSLSACHVDHAALTIVVTGDEEVRTLNREFRNIDAVTDVLSFPNADGDDYDADDHDADNDGNDDGNEETPTLALPAELREETEQYLGDIIIAYPYTMHQAAKYNVSMAAELRLLTVHGVLHLLGYDHATDEEEAEMWQLQTAILSTFGDQIDLSQRVYEE